MNIARAAVVIAVVVVAVLAIPLTASAATLIAYDDAADAAYSSGGPYHSLNGGFGFDPWVHSLPAFPAGSGGPLHAYIGSSASNDPIGPPLTNIDTAGKSWGDNADPTGNTFQARRNLSATNSLGVGGTFAISYDNGDVDGQETFHGDWATTRCASSSSTRSIPTTSSRTSSPTPRSSRRSRRTGAACG
jgi:hypothetical protein